MGRPSFFKILINDFSKKLRIPSAFIKHLNGTFPGKSTLRSPTGRRWSVKVEKDGRDLFFRNGWPGFVEAHSLELGDFVVFTYIGNSKFNVKIYDRSACEKELTNWISSDDESISHTKKQRQGGRTKPKRKCAMRVERKGAFVAANSFKSVRPHFIIIWSAARRWYMTVPRVLAKENGLTEKNCTVLRDPQGRLWPVEICIRVNGRVDMTTGWSEFWENNNLKVGDTCIFEFMKGRGNALQVHIISTTRKKWTA